uniref:class I poly(R)-hydroxyalkanoic acid synthase n=1 Tax=Pararhizobium sp. IMCC3301 TaxID=3067904 RepID=UPI002741CA28|nr:class I poly(R)-hydroxyalkanoic acid synthase [Pararhizobium sp. IMCC3301]
MTEKPKDPLRDNRLLEYIVQNPEVFANNLARAAEEAGRAFAAYIKPREEGRRGGDDANDEIAEIVRTLSKVGEYWLSDPERALQAQTKLWTNYMNLWSSSLQRMQGHDATPAVETPSGDKRFAGEDWEQNQFFDFLKQFYLITSNWAQQMVTDAAELDPHTKRKADFYVQQLSNAVSPSNFLLTNPELLKETVQSDGENLVRGMRMLAEDMIAGDGELKMRQSDAKKFKVGENLAVTPGKVIFQNEVCQLIQYAPITEKVLKRPLLIVPPWINKFYVLDLNPEKSFIRWAVERGQTVFVISWVNPDERQAGKSFEHYMKEGILEALNKIEAATGEKKVNAIGYCVGGTLLSVTLAYLAAKKDTRIASATLFTTQVDFTHAGELKIFVDEEQIKALEKRMEKRGYLEGSKMTNAFNMLRSNDLIWPYFVNNYMRGKEPFPFDLLYWNSDSTRMPAANHSFYMRNCYLENNLCCGKMVVDDVCLDLSKVKIPIYNLATREDHIAPALSVFTGSAHFGGPVQFVMSGSGHIAGVINPPHKNKYQYWTGGAPQGDFEEWLTKADQHPGSWWPHWQSWIESLNNTQVPARQPGDNGIEIIEDAPGSYVKTKA